MAFVFENEQPTSRFVFEDEQPSSGILNTLKEQGKSAIGGIESVARAAASPLAMAIAGWGGLGKTITSGFDEGTKTIEEMSQALNRPVMPEAQIGQEMLGRYVFEPFLERPSKELGNIAYNVTGSSIAGTIAETGAMVGIPLLFGGAKGGKRAIIEKPILERPIETVKESPRFIVEEVPKQPAKSPEMPPVATKPAEGTVIPSLESLEAGVKGGRIGDLPKYAEGSSINLTRLDTTQDVQQLLNQLTKVNEKNIGKRTISWEETRKAAEDLGWNEKDLIKNAIEKKSFSAAEIEAMRQIHTNAISDLFNTIKEIPADTMKRTDAMRMDIMDKVNNYLEIQKVTSQKSSEAGRALNIHKKMMSENPEFMKFGNYEKAIKQIMDDMGERKVTDKLIDDLQKTDFADPKAVQKIIQKYHKASKADMLYEAWLNGLLSAPPTHMANMISNTITAIAKIPETGITAMLEGRNPIKEMSSETFGVVQGIKEGTRAFLTAWKTGEPSDMWGKVETSHLKAIPGKTGEVVRMPTRALTAEDEFFKSVVYRAELNRQAYVMASKEGLKGDALAQKTAEYLDNPTRDMLDKAHQEALYRTFNDPLGKAGNTIMKLRNDVPGMKYIVPFIRTPANIAKYALERTPFNIGKILKDYHEGKLTAEEMRGEMAKPIVGGLISSTILLLANEGMITGGGPKDKSEKEMKYRTGWQPYSIKIGDTYYSYNRLEPYGTVIGMTADLYEMALSGKDDKKAKELAGQIATSFARSLSSKTFLQGISSTVDAISDPVRYGESLLEKTVGSVVPSVVGKTAQSMDSTMRQVESPLDAIKAKIPGLSETLLPKRDIWGRPIERQMSPTERFITPLPTSQAKPDIVDKELERLNLHPSMPAKKIRGVELTDEEYDQYAQRAGQRARQMVERYMSLPSYKVARDEIKKLAINNMIEGARNAEGAKMWKMMERERAMKPIKEKYGLGK